MPSEHLAVGAEVHREGAVNSVLPALAGRVLDRHVGDGLELGAGVDLERAGRHERPLLGGLHVDVLAGLADVQLGRVTTRDGAVRDEPDADVRRITAADGLVRHHEVVERGADVSGRNPPVGSDVDALLGNRGLSRRRQRHTASEGESASGDHAHHTGCDFSHIRSSAFVFCSEGSNRTWVYAVAGLRQLYNFIIISINVKVRRQGDR